MRVPQKSREIFMRNSGARLSREQSNWLFLELKFACTSSEKITNRWSTPQIIKQFFDMIEVSPSAGSFQSEYNSEIFDVLISTQEFKRGNRNSFHSIMNSMANKSFAFKAFYEDGQEFNAHKNRKY